MERRTVIGEQWIHTDVQTHTHTIGGGEGRQMYVSRLKCRALPCIIWADFFFSFMPLFAFGVSRVVWVERGKTEKGDGMKRERVYTVCF